MPFVAARCPSCGGDLQLDNVQEKGFHMYCGSQIIIQDAIRKVEIDNTVQIPKLEELMDNAANAGNFQEAYDYAGKILEIDPNNWDALRNKGIFAFMKLDMKGISSSELLSYIALSLEKFTESHTGEDEIAAQFEKTLINIHNLQSRAFDTGLGFYKANNEYREAVQLYWKTLLQCLFIDRYIVEQIEGHNYQDKTDNFHTMYLDVLEFITIVCSELCKEREYVDSVTTQGLFSYKNNAKTKVGREIHETCIAAYDDATKNYANIIKTSPRDQLIKIKN